MSMRSRRILPLGLIAISMSLLCMVGSIAAQARSGDTNMTEKAVRDAFTAQLAAMVAGDTEALGAMLDESFVLTHLTGYRQPKQEWISQMREGRFIYHRMEAHAVTVSLNGSRARLTGDTHTDSTASGSRRPGGWRLRMVQDYEWRDGQWTVLRCVTSIW